MERSIGPFPETTILMFTNSTRVDLLGPLIKGRVPGIELSEDVSRETVHSVV